MSRSLILSIALVAGCTGSKDGTTTTTLTDVFALDETGDTGYSGPSGIDPVAVGFELDAMLYDDGTLGPYLLTDGTEVLPSMILTFASEAFFNGGDQETESCIAYGVFDAAPIAKPAGIPMHDGATAYWSYEVALNLEYHTCAGVVDATKWGAEGEDLWGPFMGAHLGYAFAPMTEYLEAYWDVEGTDGENFLDKYAFNLFANYIAINDKDGEWVGMDWTSAMIFEADMQTGMLVTDDDGFLTPIDISATPPGGALPEGYLRSFAYWYQDFPLMDFSNLTDGAP